MKKKTYIKPECKVCEVNNNKMICLSKEEGTGVGSGSILSNKYRDNSIRNDWSNIWEQ